MRDPVVVQASLPRFLALNDQSRLNLRLDNVEGAAGDYSIDVDDYTEASPPMRRRATAS